MESISAQTDSLESFDGTFSMNRGVDFLTRTMEFMPRAARRFQEEKSKGVPCPVAGNAPCYDASCNPPEVCASRIIEEHPPQN